MDSLLQRHAGGEVTLVVWSMEDGPPHQVAVALN